MMGKRLGKGGGGRVRVSRGTVRSPMGAVSMMTGGRKDHWFLIMLGGVGPDSVGLPCIMSSANRENSCMQQTP